MNEQDFFDIFKEYFDLERDAGKQHDIANYSLDRMYPLAEAVGNPEQNLKIIHVAGTKGKGSTSHYIANLLNSAGCKVGLFTSPHLVTVRERFEINGEQVELEQLLKVGQQVIDRVHAAGLKPSLFEIFTMLALELFAENGCEYAVLETGIGGALDATNYVKHKLCSVITPISFDHTALLGKTIEEIASQKAGIIMNNVPVMMAKQPFDGAEKVILAKAEKSDAPVTIPEEMTDFADWIGDNVPPYLRENFSVAWQVVKSLGIMPEVEKFRRPELPARCQLICDNPKVILDAAHNGDSARRLVEAINLLYPDVHFTVVLGVVAGKDVAGIVKELKSIDGDFILTNPHTSKGSALEELKAVAQKENLPVISVIDNLQNREQLPSGQPMLFTGSFFTCLIGRTLF